MNFCGKTNSRIHPSAVIHPDAQIGENVFVGANTVIGNCTIMVMIRYIHAMFIFIAGNYYGKHCSVKSGAVLGGMGFGI